MLATNIVIMQESRVVEVMNSSENIIDCIGEF